MNDQPNTESVKKNIPALSHATLSNFLDAFKGTEQIPTHIDKSLLSTQSGAIQSAILNTLKFLEFTTEDGKPSEMFYEYVATEKSERAAIWHKVLTKHYDFLLSHVDIERTTSALVADRFRTQNISGDTVRKAVTFFLHAAKAAGLKVSAHVKAPRLPGKLSGKSKGQGKQDQTAADNNSNTGGGRSSSTRTGGGSQDDRPLSYQLVDLLNAGMAEEEQDAVWTLIRYLKAKEAKKKGE